MFGVPWSFTVPVVVAYKAWYSRPKTSLLFVIPGFIRYNYKYDETLKGFTDVIIF